MKPIMDSNWFTRFEQVDASPQYLANMEEATEHFMTWFVVGQDYVTMLTTMHEVATRNGYSGYTNTNGPIVPISSAFRGVNKEAWRPLLKKNWFSGVNIYRNGIIKPCLKTLDLQGCHHLINRHHGYELHLPNEDRVLDFLARMETVMETLRYTFSADLLAEYIQLFVVGHPFERVNYAVCMAQVNAVLYHYGYKPLLHGYFDFDCFIYDYDRIEKIFKLKLHKRG
jgi:hypothetical protein